MRPLSKPQRHNIQSADAAMPERMGQVWQLGHGTTGKLCQRTERIFHRNLENLENLEHLENLENLEHLEHLENLVLLSPTP